MEKDDTGMGAISDSDLAELLASLRVEPAPEADFESRFLGDLRERLARESVCCPARRLLWDHILQMVANFGSRKLACGASSLGLGALVLGFFVLPEETATQGTAASAHSTLSRLESSLASLRSHHGHEATACTSIKLCEKQQKDSYTDANLASGGFPAWFGRSAEASPSELFPLNVKLAPLEMDSVFSANVGF